jgi:hypothetical protein
MGGVRCGIYTGSYNVSNIPLLFLTLILIALAKNTGIIILLSKSRKNRNPCIISHFGRNGISFSPFRMMLPVGLCIAFITLRNVSSFPSFFKAFIRAGDLA